MSESAAKKLILPVFVLTGTCGNEVQGALLRTIPKTAAAKSYSYHFQPLRQQLSRREPGNAIYRYNLMPVVVGGNGTLWHEANLYILSRLQRTVDPHMVTYAGVATDLAAFKRFLEDEDIDFREFPRRTLARPTYRYRGDLRLRIRAGQMAPTTARRRMTSVIGFYRWLIEEGLIKPENPPWQDGDTYFKFTDSKGFTRTKLVKTTDVAIRVSRQTDPYDETIDDGGKLRPLTEQEQVWLIEALAELGNTEMMLIHFIALFTGARIQTILTLRVHHVLSDFAADVTEILIPVGQGTAIDTKNDKRLTLIFPRWLFEKLKVYALSERARKRREKAGDDSGSQYLFLSNRGVSMYRSRVDRLEFDEAQSIRHEKQGQAVRQFISERVIPLVRKKNGVKFRYRLHDLRASYGMNLTDQQLMLVQEGKTTLHQAREFVKVRLGHESAATTDRYLNYRQHLRFTAKVQSEYEDHLKNLTDIAERIAE